MREGIEEGKAFHLFVLARCRQTAGPVCKDLDGTYDRTIGIPDGTHAYKDGDTPPLFVAQKKWGFAILAVFHASAQRAPHAAQPVPGRIDMAHDFIGTGTA
jgi:hypothetical protein